MFGHLVRRNRPTDDHRSTLSCFSRCRRMSSETPRKSCPTTISGSRFRSTATHNCQQTNRSSWKIYVQSKLARRAFSFLTAWMIGFSDRARASKLTGYLSRQRTSVCTELGSVSGGVGSSRFTTAGCEHTDRPTQLQTHRRPRTLLKRIRSPASSSND